MSDYDSLYESIKGLVENLQSLNQQGVRQYTPIVEEILRSESRDIRRIEHTLDGLLDFCGYEPALVLYKKLCRHYFDIDPAATASAARDAIRSVDPDLPLAKVATLATLVENSVTQQRFAMLVLAAFGALALILATIGMYGVISYSTLRRTQEIGIRLALGAQRRDVMAMILAHGGRLAGETASGTWQSGLVRYRQAAGTSTRVPEPSQAHGFPHLPRSDHAGLAVV